MTRWEFRLGERLLDLQDSLAQALWRPGPYVRFEIHQPKRRVISAAPFVDRVVHHAWVQVCGPGFEARFHPHSFANRVGRGTHAAIQHLQTLLRPDAWVLRLDVQQHFQSIDHRVLLRALGRLVRDDRLLGVAQHILASGQEQEPLLHGPVLTSGDDLLAACRPRGLPIGNLTSQFWSNVYMDPLDQFVCRSLGCTAYARYVDDLALVADNPRTLLAWREALMQFARDRLRLRFHAHSAQPLRAAQGIPWLGMVLYPGYRRLKSRKVVVATRRLTEAWRDWQSGGLRFDEMDARFKGWLAHAQHASPSALQQTVLDRACAARS